MSADGSFVVTWTAADGNGDGIFGQRFDDQGAALGPAFRINNETTNQQRDSSVAVNPDGSFLVAWTSLAQDGDGEGVYARRFDADGDAIGSEFRVNTSTADSQMEPATATAGGAGFIITWTSISNDGIDREVFGQWYDSQGVAIDGEILVNSYTGGVQWRSSVDMAPNGAAVVVWSSGPRGELNSGLYGQLFERNNVPPTDITLDGDSVIEGAPAGTIVGTLNGIDPDAGETFTYQLVAGTGGSGNFYFEIDGDQLRTRTVFDFETQSSYSVRVRATDSFGETFEKVLTVEVSDGVAPDVTLDHPFVSENQVRGTVVGSFEVNDAPDATFRYTLVSGEGATGNRLFTIVGNELRTKASLNYEAANTHSIRVRVRGSDGYEQIKVFLIYVTNVNEAPTSLQLSPARVEEGRPAFTVVGQLSATNGDPGDVLTYSLVSGRGGNDNAFFRIAGDSLQTNTTFLYKARSSYSIRVRATDSQGLSVERAFVIKIVQVNRAPISLALSNQTVHENQRAGTLVGVLTAKDPEGSARLRYMLVEGLGDSGNDSFRIMGNQLRTAEVLDYETQSVYVIRVRVTDRGGAWSERNLVVTVRNLVGE
jgi:hypothetical protein